MCRATACRIRQSMKLPVNLLTISRRLTASLILTLTSVVPTQAQTAATSWTPVFATSTPVPDYSQPKYWMFAPQNPNATSVDVLFFHTTTFKDLNYVDPATGAY